MHISNTTYGIFAPCGWWKTINGKFNKASASGVRSTDASDDDDDVDDDGNDDDKVAKPVHCELKFTARWYYYYQLLASTLPHTQ